MVLSIILAEVTGAAADGISIRVIAFVAGAGGTIFGAGVVWATLMRRLDSAEKTASEAVEACKASKANAAKIADLEKASERHRRSLRAVDVELDQLRHVLHTLVEWMRHGRDGVPKEILEEVSETISLPIRRPHDPSV